MRKLIPILALAAVSGCSPAQHQAWLSWFHRDPPAAAEWAANDCGELCSNDTNNNGVVEPDASASDKVAPSGSGADTPDHAGEADDPPTLGGSCSQWSDDALEVGWTADQWNSMLNWIMARESGCDPGAYNPSGASGLLQLMPFWAAECGGSPGDLFDPWFNLACGLVVYHAQGWGAWSVV